jgi:hypothetical protein
MPYLHVEIEQFLKDLAGCLATGDIERMATFFEIPCALYHDSVASLVTSTSQLVQRLAEVQAAQDQRGMVRRSFTLRAKPQFSDHNIRILVDWTSFGHGEKLLGQSSKRFILARQADGGLKISLLEVVPVSLPDKLTDKGRNAP